jgi:hypothetical protein
MNHALAILKAIEGRHWVTILLFMRIHKLLGDVFALLNIFAAPFEACFASFLPIFPA